MGTKNAPDHLRLFSSLSWVLTVSKIENIIGNISENAPHLSMEDPVHRKGLSSRSLNVLEEKVKNPLERLHSL